VSREDRWAEAVRGEGAPQPNPLRLGPLFTAGRSQFEQGDFVRNDEPDLAAGLEVVTVSRSCHGGYSGDGELSR